MAIVKVRVQVDGVWTNLTLSNGKWVGTITAPATTSYNLANKYYPIKIEITNDAGRCHSGRIIVADRKGNDEACDHTGISIKRRICDKQ